MKNLYFFLLAICLICISCTGTNTRYPQVITPVLIAQGELYGNGQEGITEQNLAIRTQEEWDNLLNAMNSVNNVSNSFAETEIDFNGYMVIAVFDEIRGNGGCNINISNIIEYADSIVVNVQKFVTTNGYDVMNQPFYIAKIPVTNKNIVFKSTVLNGTVQNDTCYCIMDTLKGEWSWIKKHGGIGGNTWDNEFKSIVKFLNQNEDASINYEVIVEDTLFYSGNFKIQEDQWNRRIANIKLPHEVWKDIIWHVYFFNILEMEYNEANGQFEHKPSKDTLTFWNGAMDGYYYIYKKNKLEE